MNYENLKATIAANIYQNASQEVSANMVKTAMNAAVDSLGAGYQYLGIATPATNPGTPDARVFYIAATPGDYANFGTGISVADGEVAILKFDTAWTKEVTGAATAAQVTELGQKLIKLKWIGTGFSHIPNVGDTMYRTDTKTLVTRMADESFAIIPFYDGAIYTYENELYIWNGIDLILATDKIKESLNQQDKQINTIEAQQDFASKTVVATAGSDFINEIKILIPKGEIFAVYVGGDTTIFSSVTISQNNATSLGAVTLNEWVVLKATVNIESISANKYRTVVESSGDVVLKIKKLQSITKDGKLPLYDGLLNASGDVVANTDRKTTRVLFNDAPLFLSINKGLRVGYVYGNEPDNLTDGGYIAALSHGGNTILNIDAKYIGFTIVKSSSAIFGDIDFIVTNNNSNSAKLGIGTNRLSFLANNANLNGCPLYPFIQGEIDETSGFVVSNDYRISSQILEFNGELAFSLPDDLYYIVFYREKGQSTFTGSGWVTGRYELTGSGSIYIIVRKKSEDTIGPKEYINIHCFLKDSPNEIDAPTEYKFSVIGRGGADNYFDEPNIILKKGRTYLCHFESDTFHTDASGSSETLNIGAHSIDDPEQYVSIAYRTAASMTVPNDKIIFTPFDCYIQQYNKLSLGSYLNITIKELSICVTNEVERNKKDVSLVNPLLNILKTDMFFKGELLTNEETKLCCCQNLDIHEGGDCFASIGWAENTAGEYAQPEYNLGFIKCNLIAPNETKQKYTAYAYGDVVIDGLRADAISPECCAVKISENEVALFAPCIWLNGKAVSLTRIYNLSTNEWNDWQKCYINVGSSRYEANGTEANIKAIHQATGMHNWDNLESIAGWGFYSNVNPLKIGEWYYLMNCIGSYAPALLRTQDFIDFYFVCELPFGKTIDGTFVYNPTEEVTLAYLNNKLYATCRGNKGRFAGLTEGVDYYGYNQIMSSDFNDVLANTAQWHIVDLEPYWYERPSLVAFNDKLFCFTGFRGNRSYKSIEGKTLNRYKHIFYVFDNNLNILSKELFNSDNGFVHPVLKNFGNSVYSMNHTDYRNFAYYAMGDNRSELRLNRLNMQLLEL